MRLALHAVSVEKTKGHFVTRSVPFGPNERMHWALKAKWNRGWREEAFYSAKKAGIWPARNIVITLRATHPMDPDNATASIKPILDGLVDARVFEDDDRQSFDSFRVEPERVETKAEEGVVIDVW